MALIPKIDNPKKVPILCPISLCDVCYKIILKILASRLEGNIRRLISREQSGFMPNRTPTNNIIAIQEIVHSINQDLSNPPRMIIKVDIEKAYDTLNWHVILANLIKMGFPSNWVSWVSACLRSSFSLLINYQPSRWFSSSRYVREGDPISSYLFILVSQNLSNLLNKAKTMNFILGFYKDLNYV